MKHTAGSSPETLAHREPLFAAGTNARSRFVLAGQLRKENCMPGAQWYGAEGTSKYQYGTTKRTSRLRAVSEENTILVLSTTAGASVVDGVDGESGAICPALRRVRGVLSFGGMVFELIDSAERDV